MTDLEWTEKAIDLLNGLEQEDQQRIISKLEEAQDWTSHRLDKLSGYPYYKLRAGDYYVGSGPRPAYRRGRRPSTEHLRPTPPP